MIKNSGWQYYPLSEACVICDSNRKPVNTKERTKRIEGKKLADLFPYYGATGQVGYIDDYLIDGEYVLLGEDGAPFLNTFAQKAYLISGKSWVNNHAHILQSKTDNRFLCYYLNCFDYKGYVCGTTRLKLTQGQMKSIPVPVPPIEEQQRIVTRIEELFSELDSAVETLQKTRQQLEVYRQAVLKEAFDSVSSASRFLSIKNVCKDIKVGIVIKPSQYYVDPDEGIKAFRSANVREFAVNDSDWVYLSQQGHRLNKRSEIHTNDVLIVRSGYPGTACVVPEKYNGCNAIDILIAVPDTEVVYPEYLCAYTNSPYGKKLVRENKRGVAQAHLNVGGYSKMDIMIPSLEIQRKLVNIIQMRNSQADEILNTIEKSLQQAEAMRQSILKKAFEGRL